jgi:hypothetical protein
VDSILVFLVTSCFGSSVNKGIFFQWQRDYSLFLFKETHNHYHRTFIFVLLSLDGIITLMLVSQWNGFGTLCLV